MKTRSTKPLGANSRKSCSFIGVKLAVKLLHKYIIFFLSQGTKNCCRIWKSDNAKGGHFSVIAIGDGEPKKFSVALDYLWYPPFVRLLEAAEKEFGFDQQGVLAIPCEASELRNILLQVPEMKNFLEIVIHAGHFEFRMKK